MVLKLIAASNSSTRRSPYSTYIAAPGRVATTTICNNGGVRLFKCPIPSDKVMSIKVSTDKFADSVLFHSNFARLYISKIFSGSRFENARNDDCKEISTSVPQN